MNNKPKPKIRKETTSEVEIPSAVEKVAERFGVNPQQLLTWKVYPGGKVVLIAANGMKFVYEELAHDSQFE